MVISVFTTTSSLNCLLGIFLYTVILILCKKPFWAEYLHLSTPEINRWFVIDFCLPWIASSLCWQLQANKSVKASLLLVADHIFAESLTICINDLCHRWIEELRSFFFCKLLRKRFPHMRLPDCLEAFMKALIYNHPNTCWMLLGIH